MSNNFISCTYPRGVWRNHKGTALCDHEEANGLFHGVFYRIVNDEKCKFSSEIGKDLIPEQWYQMAFVFTRKKDKKRPDEPSRQITVVYPHRVKWDPTVGDGELCIENDLQQPLLVFLLLYEGDNDFEKWLASCLEPDRFYTMAVHLDPVP